MDELTLLDWKRRVFALYAEVRAGQPRAAWERWRAVRDDLFRSHAQSPLLDRASFDGLPYFDYDPALRVLAAAAHQVKCQPLRGFLPDPRQMLELLDQPRKRFGEIRHGKTR